MRSIKYIIIHCSDSPDDRDYNVNDIRHWHKERGFSDIGYHYVICRNGTVQEGRNEDIIGAHCEGYNFNSIGICLIGGRYSNGKNNTDDIMHYTPEQIIALKQLCYKLKLKYVQAKIKGHRFFNKHKTCPNFDINMLKLDNE